MKKFTALFLLALLCLPSILFAQAKQKISLLLYNGKIFTADENYTTAEAVAVDGEKIVAVGATKDLRSKYEGAKEIDLGGKLVTPGFNDAHVHFLRGALDLLNVNLIGTKTLAVAQAKVAARVRELKPGEWIIGRGWDHTIWQQNFPTRKDLDIIAPENPVFLVRVDGHVAWVNSAALKLAGIDKNKNNPEGGEIERDAAGEATGILKETAQSLAANLIPQPTVEQMTKGLELVLDIARRDGITSIQDNSGYEATKIYRAFLNQNKLTVRIAEWQAFDDSLDEIKRQRAEFAAFKDDPNRLKLTALKGFVDGTLGSRTASLLLPYSDDDKNTGILRYTPEQLTKMIIERDAAGFQIALHAIGDKANRMALDGFAETTKRSRSNFSLLDGARIQKESEEARKGGEFIDVGMTIKEDRHRIEHAQVVNPADFHRFAELGIIASMQPSHEITDKRWAEARLGEYRVLGAYAWRMMQSYGVHVPFGTDFPVESINPYRTLYAAVSRSDEEGNPSGGWQPQEKLSIQNAIRCHTFESAYAEFAENVKGEIKPGMLADLVVHSKDLLTIEPKEILTTEPVYTILGGQIIYEKK
ncbi:MAG: amidohydrolase [Pyrinomonadaceae bacterium]